MDMVVMAWISGILALVLAFFSVFFIYRLIKRQNVMYLAPAVITMISEVGSIFLFAVCCVSLLGLV